MTKLDEETLMAYVDGELDPRRAAEVEALLAEDAEARATVQMFRDSAATLRGAFDPILRELVPERLLAAANAPPTGKVHDIRLARRGAWSRFFPQTAWARAAAVALLVGAGAGYLTAQWRLDAPESTARVATADPLLNEALETTASGALFARRESANGISRDIMPLLTFRDANNRYCREFESTLNVPDGQQVSYGVACRDRDVWQPQAFMARQLIAPTLRGDPAADHSQYVPAMGGEVAGFDAIIQQLMVGEPLKPEEEAKLIGRGWR
jgi:surface antigen